jgi:tetratricopeptide (TPR) repeat protein
MCRRVYLIGFLVWIFAIQVPSARADQTNQDKYLTIYVKMHDAETLEKQGDYAGALAGFKDCYSHLAELHKNDPEWESALVIHRMDDCAVTIKKLQNEVGNNPPPTPPPPRPTPPTPPPSDNSSVPSPNVPPLQTQANDTTPNDVASLKKRLSDVELELQVTKESLKNSQIEVDTYRGQLESVNLQLQAIKNKQTVDDKVGRLLTENKALTEKLNQAQKSIDDLKSTNPKSKVALMQTQLKNLQDQFDESQSANKALQSTITTLQQHLDQAQADLVTANQRLADAGPSNSEYATIKRENEVMRGILTREIQEQAHRDMAKRLYQEEFDNLKIKSKVLQEQLDILASPMTPATTDEERALLASLKAPGPSITAPPTDSSTGNNLSATATPPPTTPSTDTGTTNTASSTPMTPDATSPSTNAAPITVANNDTSSTPATPAPSTPPATDPNSTPPAPTIPATPTPDTNTAPATVTPPTTPTPTPDNTAPAPTSPATTPDNSTTTPAPAPTTPDASAPTTSPVTPPTTTVTTTTIQQGTTGQGQDSSQYAQKARLPDEMRDTAQEAADLFKMKRYDEAAAKYQTIIDKYPESLYAWSNLGVVRYQQGDLDDALKALQQAVKLSPTDSFSYANLGIVYYEMKQYENAIDALNAAKALDPNDAKVRNYLGCACSQKGWQEAAEKEFLKAIDLDPSFGDAHFNLALVYATEKPPLVEMARKEYKKAQELGIAKDDRLEKLLQDPSPSNP